MRYILLALLCTSCVATTGDLDRAVTDITSRVNEVAQEASASADEAREAWKRGDITYAELQRQLADIRAGVVDVASETTAEVIGQLKETLEERPEVVGGIAGDASRTLIPGPLGEMLALILTAGGTYVAASKRAKTEAERVSHERDMARMMRGEPVGSKKDV